MEVISSNELFKKAQQGSEEALNILYQQNKNLIYSILKRYNYQSQDQEGCIFKSDCRKRCSRNCSNRFWKRNRRFGTS